MAKVIASTRYTSLKKDPIGVVAIDVSFKDNKQVKCYIGTVQYGGTEQEDEQVVAQRGAKLQPMIGMATFPHLVAGGWDFIY